MFLLNKFFQLWNAGQKEPKNPMKKKMFYVLALVTLFASLFTTTALASGFEPTQESCNVLMEEFAQTDEYGNIAHWENDDWLSCFTAGWVNAVVDDGHPLPNPLPDIVLEALEHGDYLQLTEPWNSGCDNSLSHPDCSIGFLKMFSSRERLAVFLAKGEFEQGGVVKDGPWSIYSLWLTADFVQVSTEKPMNDVDTELFCSGALGLAFAFDGEHPLPDNDPCALEQSENTFFLREKWNGGCIGNNLPDENCNVGEIMTFTVWQDLLDATEGDGWLRGSVFANQPDLMEVVGLEIEPVVTEEPTELPATTDDEVVEPEVGDAEEPVDDEVVEAAEDCKNGERNGELICSPAGEWIYAPSSPEPTIPVPTPTPTPTPGTTQRFSFPPSEFWTNVASDPSFFWESVRSWTGWLLVGITLSVIGLYFGIKNWRKEQSKWKIFALAGGAFLLFALSRFISMPSNSLWWVAGIILAGLFVWKFGSWALNKIRKGIDKFKENSAKRKAEKEAKKAEKEVAEESDVDESTDLDAVDTDDPADDPTDNPDDVPPAL